MEKQLIEEISDGVATLTFTPYPSWISRSMLGFGDALRSCTPHVAAVVCRA
jgi:hypothetical protein